MTITPETPEDARQLGYLATPLGKPGSGRVRYAAATHFYNRGMLSADAWDGILAGQLDLRHRPCNFVEIMPRLDEHLKRGKVRQGNTP